MRAREFITESRTVEFQGLTIRIHKKPYRLKVEALDEWGSKVLGYVEFDSDGPNSKELDPQDLWVDDKYQGQGIARVMYDYVKSRGFIINRSWDQTDAGAGFWNKHRGEDVRVWEESNSTDVISAEKLWDYVSKIHPKDQQGGGFLKSLVLLNPQYELKRVPLSSLHVPNDEDEGNDPYGRAMFVDVDHAREYSQYEVDKKPLVVDSQGYILDGAHRAWAAIELLNKKDIMAYVPVKTRTSTPKDLEIRKQFTKPSVAEGGAETSWSNDTDTITLQDILELTKHIKQINLPINDNLKSKLLHWEGNPEEIERVNQVTVSNQFPILIMVDEQGQIEWILDGNHRLHKAIQSQAKTIPAKLIRPSNLDDKAKKIFNIKEQGVAEGVYRGDWVRHPDNPWQIGQIQSIDNGQAAVTWKKTDKRKKAMSSTHAVDALQHARREFSQLTQPTHTPGMAEGKVKLHTDPGYFGAEVDDTGFDSLPVVNIPTNQLVGFEPDSKMNQPKSKVNVEKIVAGLKQGAKLPPLLVRKYKNGYQVLDGHHRFWAYKLLGVKSILSRIVPDEDIEEISKQGVAEGESNDTAISLSKLGKFHPGADTLAQFVPERATAQYALHPDKWESTFYSLTNKDSDKLKYYGPKKISIPPGTLVGDMAIANKFYRAKTTVEKQQYAEAYKASLQPYPVDVSEYRMPELLIPKQGVAEDLNELANTSLDVKEPKDFVNTNDRKQTTWKVFKFKSGKDTFLINFTVKSPPAYGKKQNWNAVNVAFGIKEKKDEYSFGDEIDTDLTARNKNQFLIYSTVINTIRRFITEYNTEIDEIIMQGAGERQEAIYQRFFQSAPKYFPGWHYNGKNSLVRDVPRQTGKKVKEQDVAEGSEQINEYRDRMYQYIKSILPTWPDYIVKDWLYANFARGATQGPNWSFDTIGKDIPNILKDIGLSVDTKWQLVPNMNFTMNMWEPKTLKRLQERAGGSSKSTDPNVHIPARDAERHATQAVLAKQQGGVRKEPVILIKTPQGYELLEGWHRTIQHFVKYPKGYTGPAYVAVAQGQQGVAEDKSNDTTIAKLYNGNYPDRNETFWDYISPSKFNTPLEIQTLARHTVMIMLLSQYRAEHIDEITDMLDDDQQEIIQAYTNDPKLSSNIIVIFGDRIIDGNHRALAAAIKGVPINYVDLEDLEDSEKQGVAEGITPKDIHKLADRKNVKWDNEPSFLKLTKQLTGKEHLDDLNQAGLNKVKQHLEKQGTQ